ncbi:MAG: YncE family protein [Bryobacteraceae bacterium]
MRRREFVLLAAVPGAPAFAVVEKAAGCVGFYTAAGARAGGVKVGNFPHEAALSPDGHFLYVTDNGVLWMTDAGDGGNTVSIVDVRAMRKAGEIGLARFRRPHGIAWDAGGTRLLVTTELPPALLLLDVAARKLIRDYGVKGKSPHMVACARGRAFVSNTDSGTVAAVDLATSAATLIPTAARPQGAVLAPDGRLFVVNTGAARITIIDTASLKVTGSIATGNGPGRIALTPNGKTLVYNLQNDNAVGFADVASGKQTATLPIGGRSLSLTMTRDGNTAFAGVQEQDRVVVISVPDRKILREFRTPKGAGPDPVIPL